MEIAATSMDSQAVAEPLPNTPRLVKARLNLKVAEAPRLSRRA